MYDPLESHLHLQLTDRVNSGSPGCGFLKCLSPSTQVSRSPATMIGQSIGWRLEHSIGWRLEHSGLDLGVFGSLG
jgi:hypothetical protein